MFRNPRMEALEYKISKLEHELAAYKRFYPSLPYYTTDTEPNVINMVKKDLEFFRVAVASVSKDEDHNQYHFFSRVITPPSMLSVNYYLTRTTIEDAKGAYDVMNYVQEDLMKGFYKALIKDEI